MGINRPELKAFQKQGQADECLGFAEMLADADSWSVPEPKMQIIFG